MKEHTKAYAAGIMDAEGCLSVDPMRRKDVLTSYARISFSNTDRRIHKWLVKMFGGQFSRIDRNKSNRPDYWKTEYRWNPNGVKHSSWFLSQILPYLTIKKREAEILLDYYALHSQQSKEILAKRKNLIVQSKDAKDRSVETETQKFSWKPNLINAYFAGLLDGDGCITIQKSPLKAGYTVYGGHVSIVNTYSPVVYSAAEMYGGRSYLRTKETENRFSSFQWQLRKKKPIELVLLKLLPYLILKRDQAKVLLEFSRLPHLPKIDMYPNRIDFRETFYSKMQKLNHPENQDTVRSYEKS